MDCNQTSMAHRHNEYVQRYVGNENRDIPQRDRSKGEEIQAIKNGPAISPITSSFQDMVLQQAHLFKCPERHCCLPAFSTKEDLHRHRTTAHEQSYIWDTQTSQRPQVLQPLPNNRACGRTMPEAERTFSISIRALNAPDQTV
jgi:hypothetical protein